MCAQCRLRARALDDDAQGRCTEESRLERAEKQCRSAHLLARKFVGERRHGGGSEP